MTEVVCGRLFQGKATVSMELSWLGGGGAVRSQLLARLVFTVSGQSVYLPLE